MAPLGDRLLVQPEEDAKTTAGGLIMSTSGTKQIHDAVIGTVVAVGEDVEITVAKGDTVLFSKQGSSDVPVPDGEVCFVQQRSILAKLS
jgi:chaperonin GroES